LLSNRRPPEKLVSKAYLLAKKYISAPETPEVPEALRDTLVTQPAQLVAPIVKSTFVFPEIIRRNDELSLPFVPAKIRIVERTGKWRTVIFAILMVVSVSFLAILFGPPLYFRFFSHEVVPVQTQDLGTPLGGAFTPPDQAQRQVQLPPQQESLPEGNRLIISRIGVNTDILESEVPEESLVKGVWRVPDFAKPGVSAEPMILAAHRFGYNWWWKGEYWRYHSFNLLPNLEPGDLVEVISDKRKYLYEIYAGEEGTEITDYNADLILYTCKFLNSEIRHFRYARRIDPSKYSDYEEKIATVSANIAQ